MVEIETKGRKIIIRVQEQGSFASGSADLQPDFIPVLEKLIDILRDVPGHIAVEGHTDNVPIKTVMYPSNWDLSVARALEVAHGLFDDGLIEQNRFSIKGLADTQPLVPNNTPENRTRNRRVEIVLQEQTDQDLKRQLREDVQHMDANEEELDQFFELDPDEIF
jgi:chemotaxis protein MotB